MFRCPSHPDGRASLHVEQGDRGALLRCYAGCETNAIVAELGLTLGDLFDAPRRPRRANGSAGRIVATYGYTDERGELLYQVVRFDPKGFRQRRPDGAGEWTWNLEGVRRVLYRLPEVMAAIAAGDPAWIVEGERDAETLRGLGCVATCNAGGASKWRDEYAEVLRDAADVRVVADRDAPGYRHARDVARSLRAVGAQVCVFEALAGKDVTDHLDAGRSLDDLVEIDPEARLRELERGARVDAIETGLDLGADAIAPREIDLDSIAFSGARLLDLLQRPPPEPVCAGVPPEGHLAVLVAPAITGKTSLALWCAMARAAGVAPWPGAPVRPAGRVLLYSIDEAPEQVVRRMNGLAMFHPAGLLGRYAHNLMVIGPDREIDPAALEALRFDERGLATLAACLERAEREGAPIAEVYIDAFADVLPIGESENSNEEATRIGGALERLAVRYGCAIELLHHAGKPRADAKDEPDLRFLGRGASALAAKARTVFGLELVPGMPHLRRIRTLTNLGRAPRPALYEVCAPEADAEELVYWRPADPGLDEQPEDYLTAGASITTTDLARLLAGDALEEDREPPGEMKRRAAALRERWRRDGLVTVVAGARGAKLIRLAEGGDRVQ
jgi:hypothetical protein